ncbi:MAG: tRNA dihydrouridine synthase DusB [Pseudomonadota bacterium]
MRPDVKSALSIGPHTLDGRVLLAPMAGISDLPFRQICRRLGAALATTEMLHADQRLWESRKSASRLRVDRSAGLVSMQIAGADPEQLAQAARACEARGADLVDINMGCPAKKVCQVMAGSALMSDPGLIQQILERVVAAVAIPVTMKMRTGPAPEQRNAPEIARLAEQAGIQALVIHGRTRADRFRGQAEYDTIAECVSRVSIPVIANGDITSDEVAATVLRQTGAAGVMIGRGAQGDPWLLQRVHARLAGLPVPRPASRTEIGSMLLQHLATLEAFYGPLMGPKIGRKHIGWYLAQLNDSSALKREVMTIDSGGRQREHIARWFGLTQLPEAA